MQYDVAALPRLSQVTQHMNHSTSFTSFMAHDMIAIQPDLSRRCDRRAVVHEAPLITLPLPDPGHAAILLILFHYSVTDTRLNYILFFSLRQIKKK